MQGMLPERLSAKQILTKDVRGIKNGTYEELLSRGLGPLFCFALQPMCVFAEWQPISSSSRNFIAVEWIHTINGAVAGSAARKFGSSASD